MKTHKHLYPLITDFENLWLAFKAAARGKRSRPDVAAFEFDLEPNLLNLQADLRAQTYRPGAYHSFTIHDPKPRLISAAPFRDRVVHHALCNIIEPLFERRFIHDSYACRVGKGTHAALTRAQQFARQYSYVLKCDLVHFFPSIDHAVLQSQLRRVLAAADVELDKLRTHVRLCRDLQLISFGQYEHAAQRLTEVGRLLGGWQKAGA